jgi:hypothetical protein
MGKQQKKTLLGLAFMKEIRGEAPDALAKGTELSAANSTPEHPALEFPSPEA